MTNTIHIALGFDNNYAMPCGVTIVSICENTKCDIHFHAIIADDVTDEIKKQIEGIVNKYDEKITYYVISEEQFGHLRENAHITRSTYNRFLIPTLLSEDIHKVLYLDTDLIAVQSIEPLWNTVLESDEPAAMAIDARCSGVKQHNAINLPLSQPYYNAGVLLMNLSCWRRERISNKCIDAIIKYQYPWMDQDALNVIIGSRVKKLHLKYNLQITFLRNSEDAWEVEKGKYFKEVYESRERPIIIHYSETHKPWQKDYEFCDKWLYYKDKSPWKNIPLKRSKIANTYIWQMAEAFDLDDEKLSNNAPAYFIAFQKTVHKHKIIYYIMTKFLWMLAKIL